MDSDKKHKYDGLIINEPKTKRIKINNDGEQFPSSLTPHDEKTSENDFVSTELTLSLSPPSPSPDNNVVVSTLAVNSPQQQPPSSAQHTVKPDTITPPYPWATDRRAHIHTVEHLLSLGITEIFGEVRCKSCDRKYPISYDLRQKFLEVHGFVEANKAGMRQRAPDQWTGPKMLRCVHCEKENSARPVIACKKRNVNWLFLLLGQMLGSCKLGQLRYLCKHTGNHRTGAKDRVLYLAYLELCRQLDPSGPFDI